MKILKLKDFTRGWMIGDFTPAILQTKNFEFGVKDYKAGDQEDAHLHKVATEFSVIVSGEFKMNDQILKKGDVLVMEPNDIANFSCISDGSTAVIKVPSVKGDKYLV
jgi:quercetin dioxygenase-like cupin family protein